MQTDVLSREDLVEIVERASPLDERLSEQFIPCEGTEAVVKDERLKAWCQSLGGGDWDRLQRRLAWDGLDLGSVRRALGRVHVRDAAALPEWAELLAEALRLTAVRGSAGTDPAWPADLCFLDTANAQPFEEILAPFVVVARRRLAGRTAAFEELLSETARVALERTLLWRLSFVSGDLLLGQFESMRAQEQSSWDRLFALAREPESRSLYRQFVQRLAEGGLARLFREYPVLARSLGTISVLWVEAQAEFLGRLEADMPEIERAFGAGRECVGNVAELEPSLSDAHRGGRSVVALTFASGLKLVYKPKDLGTEAAYHALLSWLNEQAAPLRFKVLKVLNRSTHGWSEFVEHLACQNRDEGRRFYERAGMLLCLFYVLEVTDCHYENLIASGEFPVLVDAETLMHHRADSEIPADDDARSQAFEQMYHSVLRSGLLPRWELSADRQTAYHLSGLSEPDDQNLPALGPKWVWINTDRMAQEPGETRQAVRTNIPRVDGAPLSLHEHSPQVVDGFRRLYEFLVKHRDALLDCDPLRELAREQVRYVYRPTGIYVRILRNLHGSRFMRDGADRSIGLEKLGRRHVPPRDLMPRPDERPLLWPVFAAERRAMESYDVPYFTARATSDALIVSPGEEIQRAFEEPSFNLVVKVLEGLDDDDLEQQVAFIEATLYAHLARETTAPRLAAAPPDAAEEDAAEPSNEAFLASALALAEGIRSRAIRTRDGSASWIAPQLLVQAGRYRLEPLHFDFYSGTSGVALFLAAAERSAPGTGLGDLALAAIRPMQNTLHRRPHHVAEMMGIGGAGGLGSVAYCLVRISGLLDEPALLDEARLAAGLISDDLIATDTALDVIGGAAGAILGLLALYEALPDRSVLERAVACGEHLLATRRVTAAGPRAWVSDDGMRTTGFSHGTAGIAYALMRLYEHAGDGRLLEAAQEAIAYENTRYSPEHGTWVDYAERGDPLYLTQWCRGAAGIGLARVAGLNILDTEQVREDIERALQATREFGPQGLDQPCCGSLGRAETLLSAGRRLSRPELTEAARSTAWRVVARAERRGGFVLDPRLPRQVDAPPGFFQGTAGIGYELLRMARPDELPCVLMWE